MKRFFALLLALMLTLGLAGCLKPAGPASGPTDAPSSAEPTEEPTDEPTEAPTEKPTEAPTEAPVTGIKDFYALVEPNSSLTVDLDFDGDPDTVSFSAGEPNEYDEYDSTVTIIEGDGSESSFAIDRAYITRLIVLDCDETDSRLDIVACWCQESDDWSAMGFRISELGSGVVTYEGGFGFILPADYDFHSEKGFRVFCRADVLGTYDLDVYYTLTAEGFKSTDDLYLFPIYEDPDIEPRLTLERELEVKLLTGEPYDFTETGETYTIPVGADIYPFCTDLATYVIVRFEGDRYGLAELAPRTGEDEWGYLINGIDQDEYGQIPYAD